MGPRFIISRVKSRTKSSGCPKVGYPKSKPKLKPKEVKTEAEAEAKESQSRN